jgi:class 3 adenylate cyclase
MIKTGTKNNRTVSAKPYPRYRVLRLFLSSIFLYYFLVFPFLIFLFIKNSPQYINQYTAKARQRMEASSRVSKSKDTPAAAYSAKKNGDKSEQGKENAMTADSSVNKPSTNLQFKTTQGSQGITINGEKTQNSFNSILSMLFRIVLLTSIVLGYAINVPFKRFFNRKRKGLPIKPALQAFCKKYILLTPHINSVILIVTFGILHCYMAYILLFTNELKDALTQKLFTNFLFVSLVASLLSISFVFFWQKHRVHIRYIEHLYSPEELQKRIFLSNPGRIKFRLYLASATTTLLPLTIVILYMTLSLTSIKELGPISATEIHILLGDYVKLFQIPGSLNAGNQLSNLYYINAIDNLLMFFGIGSGILVSMVYIIIFVNWTTQGIIQPVKELLSNMKLSGEGILDNFTLVRTNDEIGELSEGYNSMTHKLKDYITHISAMNAANARFVPRQFLEFLGKDNLTDIALGDQIQKEMTVLFSDIRSFTELSEGMTPKENFDFINHYLGYMEPVIAANNGFIDKYIGDAIMALFGDCVEDAIDAAIDMRRGLSEFNNDRQSEGQPAVDCGIGIHTGNLMLGIVGGEGRMAGTVISDAVNLASRLEGLTKTYKSSIIISEDTLLKIKDPGRYTYRFLDVAKVKGKHEATCLYEIIDGESVTIRKLKSETLSLYNSGIELFKNKQYSRAAAVFEQVLRVNKADAAAHLYYQRCLGYESKATSENYNTLELNEDI